MDILKKYEEQNPEVPAPASQWKPSSDEYGWPIRFVMRFSGGRIQNETQANHVLLGVVGIMFLAAILILFVFSGSSSEGKARFSTVCFPVACPK